MRLILHIGTHKTGTTAIQRFLVDNRSALAQHGFHYAAAGPLNANVVANAIALGDSDAARDFFDRHVTAATKADAAHMIVSAENFWSLATVGAALSNRMPDEAEMEEPLLVKRLESLLPAEVSSTEVVCYLRRPDLFAESLYNQRIKYETYDEPFDHYLRAVGPMFDYHRNASVWAEVFGRSSCTFQVYESVAGDVRQAFLRDALGVTDTQLFVDAATRDNERISRDVLEFKRELNRTTPDSEREQEYRKACLVEQRLNLLAGEPRHYQEFMSPAQRAAFLAERAAELAALQSSFELPAFPPLDGQAASADWTPYPGLSDERRAQIQQEYARINGRLSFRLERVAVGSSRRLRRHPAGRALVAGWRRTRIPKVLRRVVKHAQGGPET